VIDRGLALGHAAHGRGSLPRGSGSLIGESEIPALDEMVARDGRVSTHTFLPNARATMHGKAGFRESKRPTFRRDGGMAERQPLGSQHRGEDPGVMDEGKATGRMELRRSHGGRKAKWVGAIIRADGASHWRSVDSAKPA
jgi:hypothetical protein